MSNADSSNPNRLDEIIAEYLAALESGDSTSEADVIAKNPEYADRLHEFFADKQQIDELANPGMDKTPHEALAPTVPPTPKVDSDVSQERIINGSLVGESIRYFGDYELLEEIARGGMGIVYKARQVSLNRIVALKMILLGQFASDDDVKRFYSEAEAAASLDHPGIVPIFEVGQHEQQHFFAMGYVDGQSLAQKLVTGPLPSKEAAEVLQKIADAVSCAHEHGVIHRDLKPANVLIDRNGQPRITDFGLAKRIEADSNLTATGQIVGTPSFMPPEQAEGKSGQIGPAADIYAIGAVLYNALVGRPPFQAASAMETLLQVREREPPSPRQLNVGIPKDLETICLKCLEKDPQKRYSSAQEIVDELGRFTRGEPIHARPVGTATRVWRWCRRNPALASSLAAISALLVTITVGAVLMANQERTAAARERGLRSEMQVQLAEARSQHGLKLLQDGNLFGLLYLFEARKTVNEVRNASNAHAIQWAGWYQHASGWLSQVVGPPGEISYIEFSPTQSLIAISSGNQLQFWNLTSGQPEGAPIEFDAEISSLLFSPDGNFLAIEMSRIHEQLRSRAVFMLNVPAREQVGQTMDPAKISAFSPDNRFFLTDYQGLQLWDAATCKPHGSPFMKSNFGSVTAFHPAGTALAVVPQNDPRKKVQILDPETRQPRGEPLSQGAAVSRMAFSPDGHLLAIRSNNAIKIWKIESGELHIAPLKLEGSVADRVYSNNLIFSTDGKLLAADVGSNVYIWETETGQPHGIPLEHPGGGIDSITITRDGKFIAANGGGAFSLWNMATSRPINHPASEGFWGEGLVQFNSDRTLLATSTGNSVLVWNTTMTDTSRVPLDGQRAIASVAFSNDGRLMATADVLGMVCLREQATGRIVGGPLPGIKAQYGSLAFSRTGDLLAVGSNETVSLWDTTSYQRAGNTYEVKNDKGIGGLSFSDDGQLLASLSPHDGTVTTWNVGDGDKIARRFQVSVPMETSWHDVAFSADSKLLVAYGGSDLAHVWDVASGEPVMPGKSDAFFMGKLNANRLLLINRDNTIQFWDTTLRRPVGPVIQITGTLRGVAIDPSGKFAAISIGNSVELYCSDTGKPMRHGLEHPAIVTQLRFSPNGQMLTVRSGNDLWIWDTSTWQPLGPPTKVETVFPLLFNSDSSLMATRAEKSQVFHLPNVPGELREMELRTWIALGAKLNSQGVLEAIDSTEWLKLREELADHQLIGSERP